MGRYKRLIDCDAKLGASFIILINRRQMTAIESRALGQAP